MSCQSRLLRAALIGVALLGTACSDLRLGVYRIDVQQGNVLTEEMLAQLTPGMEKRKVRFLLGTPMLVDTFNQDRWDYIYTFARGGGNIEQRQITLFFEKERLARIEGDVHRGDGSRKGMPGETLVLVPEESGSKGFLDVLRPSFDFLNADNEESAGDSDSAVPIVKAGSEMDEGATEVTEPAGMTQSGEEVANGSLVSEAGSSGQPRSAGAEEGEEGWFRDFLQYLEDAVPSSQVDNSDSSSVPTSAQNRQ